MLRTALCLLFVSVLAGCASSAAGPAPDDTDYQKVAAIERAAKRSGVQVIWMRMPTKATPAAPGS